MNKIYKDKIISLIEFYKYSTKLAEKLNVSRMSIVNWQDKNYNISQENKYKIDSLYYAKVIIPSLDKRDTAELELSLSKMDNKPLQEYLLNKDITNHIVSLHAQGSLEIETGTTEFEFNNIINSSILEKDIEKQKILEVTNLFYLTRKIITEALNSESLNLQKIKDWHYMLMSGIREDAGEFSKYQRIIPNLDIALTHPDNIVEELNLWVKKYQNVNNIDDIASAHIDFEMIHPFGDGNGRIGRLIMMYQLVRIGYTPALIDISNKVFYYEALKYANKQNNIPLEYFIMYAVLKMEGS